MQFAVTKEETLFREEVRDWLQVNAPRGKRPHEGPGLREFDLAWQRRQYEGGWAGIAWPAEYGGRGLSATQQLTWYEECARAGVPVYFVRLTLLMLLRLNTLNASAMSCTRAP